MKVKFVLILNLIICLSCNQGSAENNASEMTVSRSENEQRLNVNDTGRNRKIIESTFNDWTQDRGSFFDLLDENVVWHVTGQAPFSGVYRGKEEFMNKAVVPINDFLSTSIKPELVDINAFGNIVWLQWKGTATAMNGGQYINEYAWKLRFDNNGKIVAVDAFLDTYTLGKLVEK